MHATGAAAAFVAAAAAVLGIQSVRHRARRRGGRQPYRVRRTSFAVDHRSGSRGSPTQHVGTGAQAGRAARSSTSDGGGYGIATALEAQSSFTPPRFEWLSEHTAPAEPASDARSVEPLRPAACRWVTTAEEIEALARVLDACRVFGIDTEHHHQRSFRGFLCLIQISTRDENYILDPLAPGLHWRDLSPLQSSFANPGIVKVLHGCAQDALWLRRDFGLLLCNVFDTAVASRLAHCPSSSYAALVAHFFSATLPKEHQLSDWSMRPLDPERESYARHDTHYLLPLYDRLLALLHQRDGQAAVDAVFEGAHDLVTREWTDPTFTERGAWRRLLRALRERSDVDNPTQEGLLSQHRRGAVAFIRLSKWRFEVAKREDLSPKFLLSDPDLLYVSLARPEGVEHVRDAAATSPGLALVSGGAEAVAALLDAVRSMPTDDVLDFVARCPTFGRVGAESGAAGGSGRSFDRSKPLYSNTQLVAPDGTVLAKIGAKKAAWYVKMDLVDQVAPPADAPGATVLRLKFAPKGRGNAGDAFALGEKLNRCVVCGVGGSLRRSYVVPRQFRALFPHEAKANMSHDVVLACGGCHSVMQRAAASLVAELKDEAGVGSAVQPAELAPLTDELKRMVSFGKALRRALKGQHQLPPARRAEMEATVRRFVGAGDGEAITLQHLDKVDELYQAGLQRRRDERSAAGSSSAELIVAALVFGLGAGDVVTEEMRVEPDEATQRRLKQFVKRFRERFVEQVRPKHLPDGWSVDYKVMRGLSKTVRLQKEQEAAMRRGHSGVGGAGGAGGSATPDAQDDSGGDSSGDDDADDDDA